MKKLFCFLKTYFTWSMATTASLIIKKNINGIDLVLLLRDFDSNSVVKSTTSRSIRFNAFSLNHASAFTYVLEGLNECISIMSSISMGERTFEFYGETFKYNVKNVCTPSITSKLLFFALSAIAFRFHVKPFSFH